MIKFADRETRKSVRDMWRICFEDSDEYMDIHFSRKYKDENTLIAFDPIPAASLQMLPYDITFYCESVPFSYISGACTLPEFRRRGHMEKLLLRSFEVMQERERPLSILIPAEDWLFTFYEKYGYSTCFQKGEMPINIKGILKENDFDLDRSYDKFQSIYSNRDFCVQKSKFDFETIVLENQLENYPDEYDQSAMVRIIDAEKILSIFARHNTSADLTIEVSDKQLAKNNNTYKIEKGNCSITASSPSISIDINRLAQLVFGVNTQSLDADLTKVFKPHTPIINLMY